MRFRGQKVQDTEFHLNSFCFINPKTTRAAGRQTASLIYISTDCFFNIIYMSLMYKHTWFTLIQLRQVRLITVQELKLKKFVLIKIQQAFSKRHNLLITHDGRYNNVKNPVNLYA